MFKKEGMEQTGLDDRSQLPDLLNLDSIKFIRIFSTYGMQATLTADFRTTYRNWLRK